MKPLFVAAAEIQDFLRRAGQRFCIIGGIAQQRWGEPRFTRDVGLLTCSAEDLIVLKAFAGRERDWADIESIVIRYRSALRWPLILAELTPLLELRQTPENLEHLQKLRHRIEKAR